MGKNFRSVLLTVLTISVFTIAIIELTGISKSSIANLLKDNSSDQAKSSSQAAAGLPKTTMEFYEKKYDFGTQKEGAKLTHIFKFKNTGSSPLIINKTDVTCGCTVPSFSDKPVAPGADGEITVTFNSSGKSGKQAKNIIVHSNAVPEAVSIGILADIN